MSGKSPVNRRNRKQQALQRSNGQVPTAINLVRRVQSDYQQNTVRNLVIGDLENRIIREMIFVKAYATVARGDILISSLSILKPRLEKAWNTLKEGAKQYGKDVYQVAPARTKQYQAFLAGIDSAVSKESPDDGTALRKLPLEDEDISPQLADAVDLAAMEAMLKRLDNLEAARRKAHLDSLNPDQREAIRVQGLIRWGIETIGMVGKPLHKARELYSRLEKGQSLGSDEKTAYHDLETRLTGSNPSARIGEVMRDEIQAVTWDQVTIRLS